MLIGCAAADWLFLLCVFHSLTLLTSHRLQKVQWSLLWSVLWLLLTCPVAFVSSLPLQTKWIQRHFSRFSELNLKMSWTWTCHHPGLHLNTPPITWDVRLSGSAARQWRQRSSKWCRKKQTIFIYSKVAQVQSLHSISRTTADSPHIHKLLLERLFYSVNLTVESQQF